MVILIIGNHSIIYVYLFSKGKSLSHCFLHQTIKLWIWFSWTGHGFMSFLDIVPSPSLKSCVFYSLVYILITQCAISRYGQYRKLRDQIDKNEGGLEAFSRGYEIFGFTRR